MATNGTEPTIKEQLYGWWYDSVKSKDRIYNRAVQKALDLPEDMGDINAPKTVSTKTGMGWQEIAAMGALGLGGMYLYNQEAPTRTAPVASASDPLEDREYQIIFRDQEGNIISVPRWPGDTTISQAQPSAKPAD